MSADVNKNNLNHLVGKWHLREVALRTAGPQTVRECKEIIKP